MIQKNIDPNLLKQFQYPQAQIQQQGGNLDALTRALSAFQQVKKQIFALGAMLTNENVNRISPNFIFEITADRITDSRKI